MSAFQKFSKLTLLGYYSPHDITSKFNLGFKSRSSEKSGPEEQNISSKLTLQKFTANANQITAVLVHSCKGGMCTIVFTCTCKV